MSHPSFLGWAALAFTNSPGPYHGALVLPPITARSTHVALTWAFLQNLPSLLACGSQTLGYLQGGREARRLQKQEHGTGTKSQGQETRALGEQTTSITVPEFPSSVSGGHQSPKIGKAETDKIATRKGTSTLPVWGFNTPLLVADRTSKKEKNTVRKVYCQIPHHMGKPGYLSYFRKCWI